MTNIGNIGIELTTKTNGLRLLIVSPHDIRFVLEQPNGCTVITEAHDESGEHTFDVNENYNKVSARITAALHEASPYP